MKRTVLSDTGSEGEVSAEAVGAGSERGLRGKTRGANALLAGPGNILDLEVGVGVDAGGQGSRGSAGSLFVEQRHVS